MRARVQPKLAFIVMFTIIFSFFSQTSVQAQTISGEVTWSEDPATITDSLVIESGAHLTIESGVTVTMACSGEYDVNEIRVDAGGWLTADGVTFQGDGTAGCWRGIEIFTGDGLTTIENSIIRDVQIGIYVEDSSPTIRFNEIYNVKGFDAPEAGMTGYPAYGIWVATDSERPTPLIEGNYIHHLTGGAGMTGEDAVDGTGATGGVGGDGGSAIGIRVEGSVAPVILNNRIENLMGGACGNGGAGGDGYAGLDGALPGDSGERAGDGGSGGAGGRGGTVWGISTINSAETQIIGNEIAYLTQPDGCIGGTGGNGGTGGEGIDGSFLLGSISGGAGGQGGNGGMGGRTTTSDYYGVSGIFVYFTSEAAEEHDTIKGNVLHDFYAGDGIQGGAGGLGGNGGLSGDAEIASTSGVGNGGAGGGGGAGGHSGGGMDGYNVIGISVTKVVVDIEANTIYDLYAGDGGVGSSAGDGGDSSDAGVGGYNPYYETYGDGGNGWAGGPGGSALPGGMGGYAYGITVDGGSTLTLEIFNNDIWSVNAGAGGDGAAAGTGGDGGDGGDTYDTSFGTGGQGGPGSFGGDGASGGDGGLAYLVHLDTVIGMVYNNTLVDSTAHEYGGVKSLGGSGGTGGLGGDGGTDGADGSDGSTGSMGGNSDGGWAVGIHQEYGDDQSQVFNNILYHSVSLVTNTIAIGEQSCELLVFDYNNIYGWASDYDDTEPGPNTVTGNPLFVSSTDHSLLEGSPCVDAGNNTGAPSEDINGDPRPYDGDGVGGAVVDIGAYEASDFLKLFYLPLIIK